MDINIPKQPFEKQMQITNINVWTDPSENVTNFAALKSQCISDFLNIGFCLQNAAEAQQRLTM